MATPEKELIHWERADRQLGMHKVKLLRLCHVAVGARVAPRRRHRRTVSHSNWERRRCMGGARHIAGSKRRLRHLVPRHRRHGRTRSDRGSRGRGRAQRHTSCRGANRHRRRSKRLTRWGRVKNTSTRVGRRRKTQRSQRRDCLYRSRMDTSRDSDQRMGWTHQSSTRDRTGHIGGQ